MIHKPFDKLEKTDIDALVTDAVREGRTIEYKEELPSGRDDDKKEFLADISSFANASGGDLVYGIEEARDAAGKPTGIPNAAVGLAGINADQEIRRLEQMIRTGIEPRILGCQIRAFENFTSGPILVVRIPQSWTAPHMVTFKASPRFFSRTSAGKMPLNVTEIRAQFVQSEAVPERIRRFREERIGRIISAETPVPIHANPCVVLHVVPIRPFSGERVDVESLRRSSTQLRPIGATAGWDDRLNLDGIVTYSKGDPNEPALMYTQLFRTGAIEAVDAAGLMPHAEGLGKYIAPVSLERDLIEALRFYLGAYTQLGFDSPIVILLSLIGVKGYYMYIDQSHHFRRRRDYIERDTVLLPEIVVEDLNLPPDVMLRPLFDLVWQACGFPASRNYDQHGKWKHP